MTPREAGGKAAFDAFWKGGKNWAECEKSGAERWKEFWCEIAAKACEATELAASWLARPDHG